MAVSGRIDGDALVAGDRSRGGHVQVTKKFPVHSFLPFMAESKLQVLSLNCWFVSLCPVSA